MITLFTIQASIISLVFLSLTSDFWISMWFLKLEQLSVCYPLPLNSPIHIKEVGPFGAMRSERNHRQWSHMQVACADTDTFWTLTSNMDHVKFRIPIYPTSPVSTWLQGYREGQHGLRSRTWVAPLKSQTDNLWNMERVCTERAYIIQILPSYRSLKLCTTSGAIPKTNSQPHYLLKTWLLKRGH